ncbi:MAG: M1 family metallopeptidase [Acidimicrobiales bacterium]
MTDPRLPRAVLPRRYDLELAPDLGTATFTGTADIEVTVAEATDRIVLHAAELVINAASLTAAARDGSGAEAPTVAITDIELDDESERLILHLDQALVAGEATLHLEFTGELNDRLRGFYRSTFVDTDGVERTIATTQFESTNARRAFPCWDEPEHKAVFAVTLIVDADLMAISSAAEVERTPLDGGRVAVRFAPTMALSTYLLAFVVGPLEATEAVDVDGVPLRIVHPIGKGHLTDFALDIGAFSLRHFSDYFAIPYPGDKLDLVAVPDFAFGAMENMGCATFREALLLIDPETSTQPEQQRAADVIAHEIAHMWFGDLVTMSWWNGIWLKEAFATFCEMHCTDAWRPEWDRWVDFGLSRTAAFDVDALASTRAIEFDVTTPDEAEAMYDVLTYEKGAAVVRMLEQYLGADRFRDGIRHYLATFAYGTADTTDLWDAIESTTGEPVREIMDSWIFQGGHPVITVERIDDHSLRLTQSPFGATDDPGRRWSVPLVLGTGGGTRITTPALLRDEAVVVPVDGPLDWVVANADGSGFYRTRLIGDAGTDVLTSLDHLGAIERYGLVDDAAAALVHGVGTLDEVRRIVEALADTETDLSVWRRICGVFGVLDRHLDGDDRAELRRWANGLIGATLDRIGRTRTDDEPPRRNELRFALVGAGGLLGDETLVDQARRGHPAPADPDANAAYVRVIAAHGDAADFADFSERYRSATTPQDERRYLFALPIFPEADQMASLLAMVGDDAVRSQDAAYLLGAAIANRDNGAMAWDWVADHWELINDRYPTNSIPRMIGGITSVGDADLAARIRVFFADHPVPQAGKTLDQSLERMALTVDLAGRLRSGAA